MDEKIMKLQELIDGHDNIVFFGGAGVSTESGIPDFRSQDGLYHQKYDFPPETILSHSFFLSHPDEFYKFYRDKMLCDTAKPNAARSSRARKTESVPACGRYGLKPRRPFVYSLQPDNSKINEDVDLKHNEDVDLKQFCCGLQIKSVYCM